MSDLETAILPEHWDGTQMGICQRRVVAAMAEAKRAEAHFNATLAELQAANAAFMDAIRLASHIQ